MATASDTLPYDQEQRIAEPALATFDSMSSVIGSLEAVDRGRRTAFEQSLLNTEQALAAATTCLGMIESNRAAAAELLGKFEEIWERIGGDWDGDGGEQILAGRSGQDLHRWPRGVTMATIEFGDFPAMDVPAFSRAEWMDVPASRRSQQRWGRRS